MPNHYIPVPGQEQAVAAHVTPITSDDWKRIQASMRRRVSGVFSSLKMDAALPWRKSSERDLLCLLEVDPSVDRIEMLPHQVKLIVEGKLRCHFPGLEIRSSGRSAVLDALSPKEASDRSRSVLTQILEAVYAERGIKYRAIPQSEILLEPRFANARYILGCRGFRPEVEAQRLVIQTLSADEAGTIGAIEDRLAPVPHISETVCAMALARKLKLDLSANAPKLMRVMLDYSGAA